MKNEVLKSLSLQVAPYQEKIKTLMNEKQVLMANLLALDEGVLKIGAMINQK